MLLVTPNPAEGVKVLVEFEDVPGADHHTLLYNGYLQIERQQFEYPDIIAVITNGRDGASPEGDSQKN